MGLPQEDASSEASQQIGLQPFLEAPLRLGTESYESFAAQLHVGQDDTHRDSVDAELRKLQIDPQVFYSKAKRLGESQFSQDEFDPLSALYAGNDNETVRADHFLSQGKPSREDGPSDEVADVENWAFRPPARPVVEKTDMVNDGSGLQARSILTVNVPQHADFEEEIMLAVDGSETRGGRLSCETPRDMSGKLQIDSLTDDEEEEVEPHGCGKARDQSLDDGNEVETFSLDPSFDYDNVSNLTRKF